MTRKFIYFAFVALVALGFSSCKKGQTEFFQSDLYGYWQEDGKDHYMRFTEDQGEKTGFLWGYEWTASEFTEDDLFDDSMYHGNSWFQYKLERDGNFLYVHMMTNKGAEEPKPYTMITLTSTKMTYKDDLKVRYSFTKYEKK